MQGKLAKVNGDLEVAKFKCDELENLARAYRNYQKISTVRLKVLVQLRNFIIFEVFGVKLSAKKSIFQNRPTKPKNLARRARKLPKLLNAL